MPIRSARMQRSQAKKSVKRTGVMRQMSMRTTVTTKKQSRPAMMRGSSARSSQRGRRPAMMRSGSIRTLLRG